MSGNLEGHIRELGGFSRDFQVGETRPMRKDRLVLV